MHHDRDLAMGFPNMQGDFNIVSYLLAIKDGLLPNWCSTNECVFATLDNRTVLTFRQYCGLYMHPVGNRHDAVFARSPQEAKDGVVLAGIPQGSR